MSGSHRASDHRRRKSGPPSADLPGGGAVPGPRAQARGRRRKARKRRGRASAGTAVMLLAAAAGWFGFGPGGMLAAHGRGIALPRSSPDLPSEQRTPASADQAPATPAVDPHSGTPAADRSDRSDGTVAQLPGLSAAFLAKIPAESNQVVLATGSGKDASDTTVTLWSRTPDGRWRPGAAWPAHNGYAGWTEDHKVGDLRSPIGVFSLSDAGGRKADPGSKLPYHQDEGFVAAGTGFSGEPLAGAFDYVVAIDYNRVTGSSPLDSREPQGTAKGGGIWLHVDHGGPTHACISLAEDHMAELLRTLDPAAHPVIVMGDSVSLAS
ncbi:L,D-transpeptidase family protein [Kitasatospora azatica]|uniref:L,D-transpeptidase family protein n=1 Tax=Kitasatospora azatica TaxID=58347 RepID=UPI00056BB402|nr:L,D-transpeptidase family protein [Kitasatospora azatica]